MSPTCRDNISNMSATDKNVCRLRGVADRHICRHCQPSPLLAVLMALAIHHCNTKHIARWRTSWATLDATGCRHRATIRTVSPRRPPGSSVLAHTTKVVAVKTAPPKLAAKRHKMDPLLTVGVYTVMVCRWIDHILARNPLLEVKADLS
jgi:hypothetical protein